MTTVTLLIVLMLTVNVQCHDYVMSREQLTHEVEDLEEKGRVLADQVDTIKRKNEDQEQRELILTARVENLTKENEKLVETLNSLSETVDRLNRQSSRGSTYIRWGRSVCPAGSQVVYSGFGAGSATTGAGGNRLCLSPNPVFDNTRYDNRGDTGSIYGAEYWINGHHHEDVLCALCRTPIAATFMVPGTNRCPTGTVLQYRGYLSSGQDSYQTNSEYICLDAHPEARVGSKNHYRGAWFEYTVTVCGTLPCPPYIADKVVTCAVCSQ